MDGFGIYWWKKNPFIRLLIALSLGIIVQWELRPAISLVCVVSIFSLICIISFFFIPFFNRFRYSAVSGISTMILFAGTGASLVWCKDIRHRTNWIGNHYQVNDLVIARISGPPVQKAKTIKANASLCCLLRNGKRLSITGNIIIYFKKDSTDPKMEFLLLPSAYGTTILFDNPLQPIRNSGNPGGFDFMRYSLFQGITHQVYLTPADFEILPQRNKNALQDFLYASQRKIVNALQKNIIHAKEKGLAEALLIGYKDDLDPELVQSYTNTGVVHIIAISGMHLALIYWLLLIFLKPLDKIKRFKWLKILIVITLLWLFGLLTGGSASVMRSAMMITGMVLGDLFSRRPSVYNSLAAAAFCLLCYDPFWLYDVGFQLSFSAVLSIVSFMRPIYNLYYTSNKLIDFFWSLASVTLAAQILTTPLSLYHFHQFPNLFLLTNFVAVPLSSVILIGEILLCGLSFIHSVSLFIGKIVEWMIAIMNGWIERIEMIPFAVWKGIEIGIFQTLLLYVVVLVFHVWLVDKSPGKFKLGILCLFGFALIRTFSFYHKSQQRKIIVYNIPRQAAIDFIDGRKCFFVGDTTFMHSAQAFNFYLQPSRTLQRTTEAIDKLGFCRNGKYIIFHGATLLLIDHEVTFIVPAIKPTIDLLIISKNARFYINHIAKCFTIRKIVFDSSNTAARITRWKKDCDSLGISYYDTNLQGAFVMNLR
jgi:competence protein ComEC